MKLKYFSLLFTISILISCDEEIEIDRSIKDTFKVTTNNLTYKTGEIIDFSLSGNPGIISFYSGEVGNDYAYRTGRIVETETAKKMSFTSAVQNGTQAGQLSLMVSFDFNGNRENFSNIESATWIDITGRFAYGTSATFAASGEKDISDIVTDPEKPLYIAFKYVTKPQSANGTPRQWMIRNFLLTTNSQIGMLTLADSKNAGFTIVEQYPDTIPAKSGVTTTTLTLSGDDYDPENDIQKEIWAVSKPINLSSFDRGPDRPIPIKGNTDAVMKNYSYSYASPGVYHLYFVAQNTNIDQSIEVIQEMEITIVDE